MAVAHSAITFKRLQTGMLLVSGMGLAAALLTGCASTPPIGASYGIEDNPAYRSGAMNTAWTRLTQPAQFPDPQPGQELPLQPDVKAFRELLNQSDSGFVFENLYAQANDAGKLYALSGLYLTNPVGYEQARKDLARRRKKVEVFNGESSSQRAVNSIIGSRGGEGAVIANGTLPNLLGGELAQSSEIRMQREILAKAHPNAGQQPAGISFGMPRRSVAETEKPRRMQEIQYAPSLGNAERPASAAASGNVPLAGNFAPRRKPTPVAAAGSAPGTLTARTADPAAAERAAEAAVAKFRGEPSLRE